MSVTLVEVSNDDLLQKLKDFNAEIFPEGFSQLRNMKYSWVVPESDGLTQLALDGDACVGAIVCRLDEDGKVYVMTLGVSISHRRQGIANMLMEHVLDVCKQKKISEIFLDVEEDNKVAIKIYKKYGFTSAGVRDMGRTRVRRMVYDEL
ncbi:hypothetical protein K1719_016308 [Acacia pycnantha]|nr:hypothetical protein K1719_016308 [Acacia pycnantha]